MKPNKTLGEDTNSTHRYTVKADEDTYVVDDAVDAFDAEKIGKRAYRMLHSRSPKSVTARMTPNAKLLGETALVDAMDEQAARLLKAIETMCNELRAGRASEALITGTMALSEHRARLVDHNVPAHMAALWENEQETGE